MHLQSFIKFNVKVIKNLSIHNILLYNAKRYHNAQKYIIAIQVYIMQNEKSISILVLK